MFRQFYSLPINGFQVNVWKIFFGHFFIDNFFKNGKLSPPVKETEKNGFFATEPLKKASFFDKIRKTLAKRTKICYNKECKFFDD